MKNRWFWPLAVILGLALFYFGKQWYMQPKYDSGASAPDFAIHPPGAAASVQLADLQGKFVLLEFWGSWCGPCRAENPLLVDLYASFEGVPLEGADGFEIVSVAIEKKEDRWKRAITRDQLYWPYHHLDKTSNYKFFNSEVARLYGVKQLPSKFLINPAGKIIMVNPTIIEVREFLADKRV